MTQPAPDLLDSVPGFPTICAQCGRDCGLSWLASANITPDAFFLGTTVMDFTHAIVEMDIAYDWCSIDCFGRWAFSAAALLGSPERPPE